jgi:folate-binding protein YgfZ
MAAAFFELNDTGIISFSGEDAPSFLHAQLTSDVAALQSGRTQYSGYCTPKGRLLATLLAWRREGEILLLLPQSLREGIQSRLAKYVMRARVKVADATNRYTLYGVVGHGALAAVAASGGRAPGALHDVSIGDGVEITRLPIDRYLILAASEKADTVRGGLTQAASQLDDSGWSSLDVEAGIPVITPASQEQYVPQMVNLDLIGAVSYTKGCYPGQEIVARMHYLGKLKQRMYRVRVPAGQSPSAGDALYSAEFGPDQASGAILFAAGQAHEALAVLQKSSAAGGAVHLKSVDGPEVELLPLPYTLPA